MAEGPILKTRRDLAQILAQNEFSITVTASKVLELLNLDETKLVTITSLLSKIKMNIKRYKRSVDSLNSEWWNHEIPWINSGLLINSSDLGKLCKETYILVLDSFPWPSITPTLHKLLAHSEELIREHNSGYGLKSLSEEGSEACNKLVRRYREKLSRKNSFGCNTIDVFVRLSSQSDPVLVGYRRHLSCVRCGQSERSKCHVESQRTSNIEALISSLTISNIED